MTGLMNVEQYAEKYYLSPSHVRWLLRAGKIKGKKMGKKWLIYPNPSEIPIANGDELERHRTTVREVAERLIDELHLPSTLDSFIGDFGSAGIHWRPAEVGAGFLYGWEVKGYVITLLFLIEADEDIEQLFRNLISHLDTSEFNEVVYSLKKRKGSGGEYLTKCHNLLDEVQAEVVTSIGVDTTFPFERVAPGLTGWFPLTICAGAIDSAIGNPSFANLSYKLEPILDSQYIWLKYGSYGIVTDSDEEQLNSYKELHINLMSEYTKGSKSKRILTTARLINNLRDLDKNLRRELQRFVLAVPVPGYCESCEKALEL